MDAANKEIDPSEEEQKGGSGGVGKLIWSECETHISCISYVHADKTSEVNAKEWMVATLKDVGGGEIIKESDTLCQAVVKADGAKDRYVWSALALISIMHGISRAARCGMVTRAG